MEIGHNHHIAGAYLLRYAQEASWREDSRRMSNGEQVNRLAGLGREAWQERGFHGLLAAERCGVSEPFYTDSNRLFFLHPPWLSLIPQPMVADRRLCGAECPLGKPMTIRLFGALLCGAALLLATQTDLALAQTKSAKQTSQRQSALGCRSCLSLPKRTKVKGSVTGDVLYRKQQKTGAKSGIGHESAHVVQQRNFGGRDVTQGQNSGKRVRQFGSGGTKSNKAEENIGVDRMGGGSGRLGGFAKGVAR
jgi:hypothetical protein